MQIKINVDEVRRTTNDHIEELFAQQGFPVCLGSMVPPIISKQAMFPINKILEEKAAVVSKNVEHSELKHIVDSDEIHYRNKVLTVSGADLIERHKKERAEKYTEQVMRCCSCNFTDVCSKLTENYLRVLAIQEEISSREVAAIKNES